MSDTQRDEMPDNTDSVPTEDPVMNDLTEKAVKPWWRRTSTLIVGVVVIALGAAGAWIVTGNDSSTTTETVTALKYAEVERTTLEDVTTLDGTLGFVAGDPLVYAGSPDGIVTITAGSLGTVTSLSA
jgi:hypothetical protein